MTDAQLPARRRSDDALDVREAKFVSLYFENPNGTNAALAAGFGNTPGSASVQATRLLGRAKIKAALAAKQAKFMQRYEVTPDRLIREFAKIAFSNTDDFVAIQADGSVIVDFGTATREELAALASIEVDEYMDGRGDGAARVKKTKFKHYDKLKALQELAKLARMYPAEQIDHSGQVQHLHAHAHKIDIASLEPEQRQQLRGVLLALKSQAGDTVEEES
jgi:phage terminase small subunit